MAHVRHTGDTATVSQARSSSTRWGLKVFIVILDIEITAIGVVVLGLCVHWVLLVPGHSWSFDVPVRVSPVLKDEIEWTRVNI